MCALPVYSRFTVVHTVLNVLPQIIVRDEGQHLAPPLLATCSVRKYKDQIGIGSEKQHNINRKDSERTNNQDETELNLDRKQWCENVTSNHQI